MSDDLDQHEHTFQYGGIIYWHSEEPRPGSSAHTRYYEDWFYCARCLEQRYMNRREHGTSYHPVLPGALPR